MTYTGTKFCARAFILHYLIQWRVYYMTIACVVWNLRDRDSRKREKEKEKKKLRNVTKKSRMTLGSRGGISAGHIYYTAAAVLANNMREIYGISARKDIGNPLLTLHYYSTPITFFHPRATPRNPRTAPGSARSPRTRHIIIHTRVYSVAVVYSPVSYTAAMRAEK